MSHTFARRPWRKQRLFRQGRELLVKPLTPSSAEPVVVVDCCGGHCGEDEKPSEFLKLLWAFFCPTPADLVAVFYGGYWEEPDQRPPERWVNEHIEHCAHCGAEWEAITRTDDEHVLVGEETIVV